MEMSWTTFIPGNAALLMRCSNTACNFFDKCGFFCVLIHLFFFRSCVRKLSKRDAIVKPMAYKVTLAGLRPVTMCLGKLFIIIKELKF